MAECHSARRHFVPGVRQESFVSHPELNAVYSGGYIHFIQHAKWAHMLVREMVFASLAQTNYLR